MVTWAQITLNVVLVTEMCTCHVCTRVVVIFMFSNIYLLMLVRRVSLFTLPDTETETDAYND